PAAYQAKAASRFSAYGFAAKRISAPRRNTMRRQGRWRSVRRKRLPSRRRRKRGRHPRAVDPGQLALAPWEGSALEAQLHERFSVYDQDFLDLARTLASETAND